MNTKSAIRMMVVLAIVVAIGAGPVLGGKPAPTGKSIYYQAGGSLWKMASDGSDKTSLPGQGGRRMSDVRYDETYWTVETVQCGVNDARTPEGYTRFKIVVAPVETTDDPLVILDNENWNPSCPTFRPGTTPRVTFAAVAWDSEGDAISAGLYQIEFSADGSSIGDPQLLIECGTFDDWLNADYDETVPQLTWQDWLDENTIVYGDGAYLNWGSGSLKAQLYKGDIRDDASTHTALIADGQPLMGFGVHFNSTGSKVIYNCAYTGIYEVATTGDATPTRWVADSQAGPIDWLDDDTIVYETYNYNKRRNDLYKMKRGKGATNLTSDVSGYGATGCGVR